MTEDHDGEFRHEIDYTIRLEHIDVMDHLNNVAVLQMFETGRVEYAVELELMEHNELAFVIAQINCSFLSQGYYRDQLSCRTRIGGIRRSSMLMSQSLERRADRTEIARATSVLVALAEDRRSPRHVPAAWRERICEYEPVAVDSLLSEGTDETVGRDL